MNNPTQYLSNQTPRLVIRVPLKIRAKIYFKGQLHKDIVLNELSTRGFSFNNETIEDLPHYFELEFRMRKFSKIIRARVEIKNHKAVVGSLRIGCMFSDISEEDKDLIAACLSRYINFYIPHTIVSSAAFLLCIDATWRILACLIDFYYKGTEFGRSFQTTYDQNASYMVMLGLYLINTLVAFFFTDRLIERKTKNDFLFSIIYLAPALVFILIKNIMYREFGLWQENDFFVRAFLTGQLLLILFTLYAIWTGIRLWLRIDVVLDSADSHLPVISQS